jgi:hypothetical protein
MHPIVRIFRCLLMLPVLGMVIAHSRTGVGLVFNGYMVKSLGSLRLAVRMCVVRLRYWLGGWMLLVLVLVLIVVIFIWLPRNVLAGLDSGSGEWQRIRLRRGGEL